MDEKKKETFSYTYSALQQKEIRSIREKYETPAREEKDKMEQLRRLDRSASVPGMAVSITVGVVGLLVFGLGMCCTTAWADTLFYIGIVIGIVGIVGMIAAYPVYVRMTKKRREKLAPEILRLSDELMK